MARMDARDVKEAAAGRWEELVRRMLPELAEAVERSPKHVQCPLGTHADENPSFRWDPKKQRFQCTCPEGQTDVLGMLQMLRGMDFGEAIERVAEELGYSNHRGNGVPAAAAERTKAKEKPPAKVYPDILGAVKAATPPGHELAGMWTYHADSGEVAGYVARYDGEKGKKQVKPFAAAEPSGWACKGMPEPRPLYRLPQIATADVVHVHEGEKCAEAVAQIGMEATTWVGGANAIGQSDWSVLAGKVVFLWPDNDDPGRRVMGDLEQLLTDQYGCRVIVVEIAGLPVKGDVFDWMEMQGDAAEPETLREQLEEIAAEADPRPKILSGIELLDSFPKLRRIVIEGLLREGEICNLIAKSKVGKSWSTYQLALSVAMGWQWLNRFDCVKGRVLIIDNELHRETLSYRIKTVADAMQVTRRQWGKQLDFLSLRGRLCDIRQLGSLLEDQTGYQLIVLDALYRTLPEGTSENDNAEMAAVYNLVDVVAEKTRAAMVLVHHATKGAQGEKDVTDVGSGAGSQARAADTHLILRPHEEDDCTVLDAAVRSFMPLEPLALRWVFPLLFPADGVDPTQLKRSQSGWRMSRDQANAKSRKQVLELLLNGKTLTRSKIREKTGMGYDRCNKIIADLVDEGKLASRDVVVRGNETEEFWLSEEALV